MEDTPKVSPTELIDEAEKLIANVRAFDVNTLDSEIIETAKSLNEIHLTLSNIDPVPPDTPYVLQQITDALKAILLLKGKRPKLNKFKPSDFDLEHLKFLGNGSYGIVCSTMFQGINTVAIKFLFTYGDKTAEDIRMELEREAEVMADANHENVVIMKGVILEDITLPERTIRKFLNDGMRMTKTIPQNADGSFKFCAAMITELLDGDMRKVMGPTSTADNKFKCIIQAAKGLAYLHNDYLCVIHRDIKPENILITNNGDAKITDFGFSRHLRKDDKDKDTGFAHGSPIYMAPEVFVGKRLTTKIDVFAFGVMMYQIFASDEGMIRYRSIEDVRTKTCHGYRHNLSYVYPEFQNCGIKELINACWAQSSHNRPTMGEVLNELMNCYNRFKFGSTTEPGSREYLLLAAGSEFWRKFSSTTTYPFKVPMKAFFSEIKPLRTKDEFKGLEPFFQDEDYILIDRFILSIKWFGLWFSYDCRVCLEDFEDAMKQQWFHGTIDGTKSESRLKGRPHGTFLVRCSTTSRGDANPFSTPFTVSEVRGMDPMHSRICRVTYEDSIERYQYGKGEFKGRLLSDLINKCLDGDRFTYPCPPVDPVVSGYRYESK